MSTGTHLRQLDFSALRIVIEQLKDFSGTNPDDVVLAVQRRKNNTTTPGNLRREEYLAFRNPITNFTSPSPDFQIRSEPVPTQFQTQIAQVILASRLREVLVLRGFTRIDPPDPENEEQLLASITQKQQNWLPAVEHRGEGIFLELSEQRVRTWENVPRPGAHAQAQHRL